MTFQPASLSPVEAAPQPATGAEAGATVIVLRPVRSDASPPTPPLAAGGGSPELRDAEVAGELLRQLEVQRRLCAALEAIADALPDNLDTQHTLHVARLIGPTIRRAHAFEEKTVFPLLEAHFATRPELSATLERLHFEHWEDESFAEELAEKLVDAVMRVASRRRGERPKAGPAVRFAAIEPAHAPGADGRHAQADPQAEALGYMLRGFFEGLRRHIAFEEEHLVPLLATAGQGRVTP